MKILQSKFEPLTGNVLEQEENLMLTLFFYIELNVN